MRPGGGYGATICAHIETRRRDHALPVRPGQQHAELVRQRDQLALERAALGAGLAVAALATKAARTPLRAHARSSATFAAFGVHTKTRSAAPSRDLGDVAEQLLRPSTSAPSRLTREDLAAVAEAQQVVERHEAELAGVRGGAGDDDAARMEERREAREQLARRCARAARRARRRRRARPARPARRRRSGVAPRTISGFTSTLRTSGRSSGEARRGPRAARPARRVDGRLAAEGLEQQPARAQAAQHPARLGRARAAPRRRPRRRAPRPGCRRGRASRRGRAADRAPGPRSARGCRAPSRPPAARPRRPRGARSESSSRAARAHRRGVGEAEAHQPALRLVGDRVAAELQRPPGSRALGGGAAAASA